MEQWEAYRQFSTRFLSASKAFVFLLTLTITVARALADPIFVGSGDPKQYGYHPNSVLALGRGFSPNDIVNDPKLPCIVAKQVTLDPGPPKTTLVAFYVRDFDDLSSATNIDAKASADILGSGGNAHF